MPEKFYLVQFDCHHYCQLRVKRPLSLLGLSVWSLQVHCVPAWIVFRYSDFLLQSKKKRFTG